MDDSPRFFIDDAGARNPVMPGPSGAIAQAGETFAEERQTAQPHQHADHRERAADLPEAISDHERTAPFTHNLAHQGSAQTGHLTVEGQNL